MSTEATADQQPSQPGAVLSSEGLGAWQPIETAPRDGSLILGTDGCIVGAMWWAPEREPGYPWSFVGEWMGMAQDNAWQDGQHGPRYWMAMPNPPQSA